MSRGSGAGLRLNASLRLVTSVCTAHVRAARRLKVTNPVPDMLPAAVKTCSVTRTRGQGSGSRSRSG